MRATSFVLAFTASLALSSSVLAGDRVDLIYREGISNGSTRIYTIDLDAGGVLLSESVLRVLLTRPDLEGGPICIYGLSKIVATLISRTAHSQREQHIANIGLGHDPISLRIISRNNFQSGARDSDRLPK